MDATPLLTCRAAVCPARDLWEELAAEDQPARAWSRGCRNCHGYVEQVQTTMAMLGSLPQDLVSADFRRRLAEGFRGWPSPG